MHEASHWGREVYVASERRRGLSLVHTGALVEELVLEELLVGREVRGTARAGDVALGRAARVQVEEHRLSAVLPRAFRETGVDPPDGRGKREHLRVAAGLIVDPA